MALFKSGNPVLSEKSFSDSLAHLGEERMTVRGTANKFGLLLLMVLGAASFAWSLFEKGVDVMPLAIGAAIAGLIVALIITFKKTWAPKLALAATARGGGARACPSAQATPAAPRRDRGGSDRHQVRRS